MADNINYFNFSDKIKFVTIELISKETCEKAVTAIKAEDVKHGLFQGFREEEKADTKVTRLIYLDKCDKNRTMEGFNPDKHNVVYIEVGHGQYREEIFFQAKPADQQSALGLLRELVDKLRKEDMVKTGTSYVDTTKYTDLPKKFDPDKKDKQHPAATGYSQEDYISHGMYGGMGGVYSHNRSGYNSTTSNYMSPAEKKRLTKPTAFKRHTVLPTEEALALMKAKILEIQEGTYKQPEFKKTKIEETKEESAADWEEDDPYGDLTGNFCS